MAKPPIEHILCKRKMKESCGDEDELRALLQEQCAAAMAEPRRKLGVYAIEALRGHGGPATSDLGANEILRSVDGIIGCSKVRRSHGRRQQHDELDRDSRLSERAGRNRWNESEFGKSQKAVACEICNRHVACV